ncbi:hypothetical protein BN59_01352 [Legionella massiliensis]|uniref:YchJ-like middle NTF2-like domain-containing protein n=1 Tax=Legionella massiliensis TaxID=1034943 RepID=A0A078KZA9_9GAMM|nr:YchJ family protein [Legionella massiliensis]CDZ77073.1 hypothetical protein BN59_01352 [Legionella massiliensis]CEE12811.1 hypothetical protein BN1094_01352 [Legionella massiliensis]
MPQCPCGSSKKYLDCCGLFIEGQKHADTPEKLMRSRYSAFTMANTDYIKKTMCGKSMEGFDESEVEAWAKQVNWVGLQVVKSYMDETDENIGYVEFIASFHEKGKKQAMHELSKFQRIDGQWFYTEGVYTEGKPPKDKTKIQKPKISLNGPCPCGSQRKYKNCHGKEAK